MGKHSMRAMWVALLTAFLSSAAAADYPDHPVRLIVPTTVGGGADTLARTLGAKLSERLGQQVVVENRAGANGMIGMDAVAKAKPDGYTLALTFTDHFVNPSLYRSQPYDLLKDFEPVIYLGSLPFVLAVYPGVPANSVAELVTYARGHPGELHFASAGTGGSLHMAGELFKDQTKIDITHVPYKGTSAAMPDLLAGRVQMIFTSAISAKAQADGGHLRLLATTGTSRAPDLPKLPTVAETGITGYSAGIWYGVLAPAKTPRPIIDKLNAEIAAILKTPDFVAAMAKQGVQLAPGTPDAFATFYRAEIGKWARVIKTAKIAVEN